MTAVRHIVYGLQDPFTQEIRYIGVTYNPKMRKGIHLRVNDGSKKAKWVLELKKNGAEPTMVILKTFRSRMAAEKFEFDEIKRRESPQLLNGLNIGVKFNKNKNFNGTFASETIKFRVTKRMKRAFMTHCKQHALDGPGWLRKSVSKLIGLKEH